MRPCLEPGCPNLTAGTRCPTHKTIADRPRNRRKRNREHYKNGWRQLARAHKAAHPICVQCGATDDLTVDHIIPGTLDGGIQTLCRRCNSAKQDKARI